MKRFVHSIDASIAVKASYFDDEVVDSIYEELESKSVPDSDGFYADYTLYYNTETGEYVTVFGDKDIYRPEDKCFDAEFDSEDEAYEWFESYRGLVDDDEF